MAPDWPGHSAQSLMRGFTRDCGDTGQATPGEWGAGPQCSGRGIYSRLPGRPYFSLFLGPTGLEMPPDCEAHPAKEWEGLLAIGTARAGPQPPPRPPGHSPFPASDLELVAAPVSVSQTAVLFSARSVFGPLAGLPADWQSRCPLFCPGPVAPPPPGLGAALPRGPEEGALALLTHRSIQRYARAQPGTPRHVTAREGASWETGPGRGSWGEGTRT